MLRFEQDGAIAVITLDRPDARNAIDGPMAQAIEAAIDRIEDNEDLLVGIVTHTGNVFCSGADLKAVRRGEGGIIRTPRGGFAGIAGRVRAKPLIAAVEGKAFGGGFEIALACDLLVASTDAVFALPEVSLSLLPTAGGVTRLTWAIPPRIALELILTAAPIDATRAADLGLVSRLVDPGEALAEARRLADSIARNAPLAVRAARRLVLEATTHDDEARIRALSDEEWLVIHASEDFQEGPRAFAEKRPPHWQGR